MRSNQKGFSEIILILVIVFLVGVVGFFVFQNNQLKQEVPTTESNDVSESVTEVTTPPTGTSAPTTNSMANWKSYQDSKASFMLPPGWSASKSPSEGNQYIITISSDDSPGYQLFPEIQISINTALGDDGEKLTLTSLSQAKTHYSQGFDDKSLEVKENYSINQRNSLMIQGSKSATGPGGGSYLQYQFIQFPKDIVVAQLSDKNLQEQFDQILSTFEFTE